MFVAWLLWGSGAVWSLLQRSRAQQCIGTRLDEPAQFRAALHGVCLGQLLRGPLQLGHQGALRGRKDGGRQLQYLCSRTSVCCHGQPAGMDRDCCATATSVGSGGGALVTMSDLGLVPGLM